MPPSTFALNSPLTLARLDDLADPELRALARAAQAKRECILALVEVARLRAARTASTDELAESIDLERAQLAGYERAERARLAERRATFAGPGAGA